MELRMIILWGGIILNLAALNEWHTEHIDEERTQGG